MDLTVPVHHRVEIKERKKVVKYLDLVRELKNLWNVKVTLIPIVIGAFGMVPKKLENKLGELKEPRTSRS